MILFSGFVASKEEEKEWDGVERRSEEKEYSNGVMSVRQVDMGIDC